jgi:hypothetical protein
MSNEELKDKGFNRAERRHILGINNKPTWYENAMRHHNIPSFRLTAIKIVRGHYV